MRNIFARFRQRTINAGAFNTRRAKVLIVAPEKGESETTKRRTETLGGGGGGQGRGGERGKKASTHLGFTSRGDFVRRR